LGCKRQLAVRESRPTRGLPSHPPLASTNRTGAEGASMVRCPVCDEAQLVDIPGSEVLDHECAGALDEVASAIEVERIRLAAELHDGPIQRVAGLGMRAYLGLRELQAGDQAAAARALEEIEVGLGREVRSLRAIVKQLRPPALSELGLVDALRDHAESIGSERVIVVVRDFIDRRLNEDVETGLYRIAQEALTNAHRHSGARRIDVLVERSGCGVRLTVRDDGAGFDATAKLGHDGGRHYGLLSMHERAALLHGSLTVTSAGGGTTVVADVPLVDEP
jgi:two-component system, NarL family, sensor kinase